MHVPFVDHVCVGADRNGEVGMTIEEAIIRNPFDPKKGNKSAYCRYLRYNVDGWYHLDSKKVYSMWRKVADNGKID